MDEPDRLGPPLGWLNCLQKKKKRKKRIDPSLDQF